MTALPDAGVVTKVRLLAKLGSLVVHVDEGTSPTGHPMDWLAVRALIADEEVQRWLGEMRAAHLLPVKR